MIRRLFPEMRALLRHLDETAPPLLARRFDRWSETTIIPPADITETQDKIRIEAELPGVTKENVRFELPDEHTLVMRAEVKGRPGRPDGERFHGVFERMFTVPAKIDPDSVQAELKDGVLTLELQKSPGSLAPLQIAWKE